MPSEKWTHKNCVKSTYFFQTFEKKIVKELINFTWKLIIPSSTENSSMALIYPSVSNMVCNKKYVPLPKYEAGLIMYCGTSIP